MNAKIPNLFEKYGGAQGLKRPLKDFTQRMLVNPSVRRCFEGVSNEQIVEYNFAIFSVVLGNPESSYDFSVIRDILIRNRVTHHTYEEIIRLLRHVMLDAGFVSRDASIAINMLDMHCETIIGINPVRKVTSPFAGVDRRRMDRPPPAEE